MPGRSTYDDMGGPSGLWLPTPTPIVKKLLIYTAIAYAIQYLITWQPQGEVWVLHALGLSPETWGRFFPFVPFWQVVTYGFLHGDLRHLFMNMLGLYFFGTMLEGIVGSRRFLVVYLTGMVAGAVLHLVAEPLLGHAAPAVGASGAVLAVMVAVAVLQPDTPVILLFLPVKLKYLAMGIVAIDAFALLDGWRTGGRDLVAHYVHLGGAIYGFLGARRGWIWRDPIQAVQTKQAIRQEEKRASDETRMDELLAKIHDQGLNALSRREKEFLKRMSKRR